MRILVFGQTGQVATELRRQANVMSLDRTEADLSRPETCAEAVRYHAPDGVIIAAAYTAVDRAEDEEALARRINGDAPGRIAQACAAIRIPIVHISTDYVFGGVGEAAHGPNDPTKPQNAYGRSKLLGERLVRESGAVHAILRTSWVFSGNGGNFVNTMLRLSETRTALNVVEDQIGGPTPADAIAAACLRIASVLARSPSKAGTYHLAGTPDVSWADFARTIFAKARRQVVVKGIPTADYPSPAIRPMNSRLDCRTLQENFDICRPDWREGLDRILIGRGQSI